MTATVEIQQVTHRFGSFTALQDINLTIEAGSFAVLLGPSGCGKTTLLSVLGGFLHPSDGAVLLDGNDVTDTLPAHRATTTMFQDYALFPHMSLLDNVGFGLRMRKQSKKQRVMKATELLSMVGLELEVRKKPHELSGGQRQRVALARALAVDPDVLLLDEPLGALDLKLRRQMQDELKAIQKRVGTTFIHVTHDQEEAMAIADKIIVMNAGEVVDKGSPESIYLRPKTVFSASFMGEANMLAGHVKSISSIEIMVITALGELTLNPAANVNGNIRAGDEVLVCFRPEHLFVSDSGIENCVALGVAYIQDHAFFGAHQRCQLMAADGLLYTANLPQSIKLIDNARVELCVDSLSIVLLRA